MTRQYGIFIARKGGDAGFLYYEAKDKNHLTTPNLGGEE